MSITRLPEIVFPLAQVNKVNEIVDVLNDNLNMYFSSTNPALTPVDGVATWTVTHNLGTENINCTIFEGDNLVISNVSITSENIVTVSFNATTSIAQDTYKIVIISNGAGSSSGSGSYVLPTASTTTLGGVRIDGSSITINNGVISAYSEYPKVYYAQGVIFTDENGQLEGFGNATVVLYGSGLAVVEFSCRITATSSITTFVYGLDSQALHSLNNNIPLIKPMSGKGHWQLLNTTMSTDANGYATSFGERAARWWGLSRMFNQTADMEKGEGARGSNVLTSNMMIAGTCYGTFTVS